MVVRRVSPEGVRRFRWPPPPRVDPPPAVGPRVPVEFTLVAKVVLGLWLAGGGFVLAALFVTDDPWGFRAFGRLVTAGFFFAFALLAGLVIPWTRPGTQPPND